MSNPSKSDQIAKGLDLMLNADKREVAYAYRDAIVSDVGDMERELNEARAEREQCRVQLAGCGVIAGCNTRSTLAEQMPTPDAYGYSASLLDVAKAVTREMNERERAERAEAIAQGWAEAHPDLSWKEGVKNALDTLTEEMATLERELNEARAKGSIAQDGWAEYERAEAKFAAETAQLNARIHALENPEGVTGFFVEFLSKIDERKVATRYALQPHGNGFPSMEERIRNFIIAQAAKLTKAENALAECIAHAEAMANWWNDFEALNRAVITFRTWRAKQ